VLRSKKLIIGSDHRGFALQSFLRTCSALADYEISWVSVGALNDERSDYPVFAKAAVAALGDGHVSEAVLLCGTGIGMSIAANRTKGIFAGVAWNADVARRAREEDQVNVLVIPADYVSEEEAVAIVTAWLSAAFREGRYAARSRMIDQ